MSARLLRRISWLCLLMLIGLHPLVNWTSTDDTVRTVQWVFFWCVAAFGLGAAFAAGCPIAMPGSPLRSPVLAFAAAMLVLPLAAFRIYTGYFEALGWLAGVAAAILAASWLPPRGRFPRAVAALVICNTLVALYGLLQYAGLDWHRWAYEYGGRRPFSTMGNPNFLGGHFVLLLPAAAGLFLWARDAFRKSILLAVSFSWVFVVLVAQTRSAWLAVGASTAWLSFICFREEPARLRAQKRWLAALLFATLLGFALLMARNPALVSRVASLVQPEFGQVAKRYAAWQAGLLLWREDPLLGIGLGCFKHGYGRHMAEAIPRSEVRQFVHTYSEEYAHNDFMQLLAEGGAVTFGLFLWLALTAGRALVSPVYPDRALARVLLAAGLGLAVHGALNLPFHIAPTSMLFWAGIGLAARGGRGGELREGPPSRFRAAGAGVLALAAGLLGSLILAASIYTRLGKDCYGREDWAGAQRAFEKSALVNWDDRREAFFAGSMRFQRGEILESTALFKREVERNPYFMDGYANLGAALGMLRDLEGAEEALRRAIALNPAYAEAHANLGVALIHRGRLDEAEEAFGRAMDLEPGLALASSGLELVRDRKKGKSR